MKNPGEKMVKMAQRLIRYLNTYPDGGISFGKHRFQSEDPLQEARMTELFNQCSLYSASDSSYGDEQDNGYSTMGQIVMMNGGPLHQKSYEYKAQLPKPGEIYSGSIMKSTVEAEYTALSNAASELMSFRNY